jgi:hypothetical protein
MEATHRRPCLAERELSPQIHHARHGDAGAPREAGAGRAGLGPGSLGRLPLALAHGLALVLLLVSLQPTSAPMGVWVLSGQWTQCQPARS